MTTTPPPRNLEETALGITLIILASVALLYSATRTTDSVDHILACEVSLAEDLSEQREVIESDLDAIRDECRSIASIR